MVMELREAIHVSTGGDRNRTGTELGFYHAAALWVAVFDIDHMPWGLIIIQIMVLLVECVQQKRNGTTYAACVLVFFLSMNYHVSSLLNEASGHSSQDATCK
ncbi:hypothetical protein CORC01_04851 [Colletotrichum orchidophilum]|uniref:Uncharacterized protein n=1 Tax=Colletotrichum orchidophilum TaxID=1209926 RepID=A0A1G4BF02_9PEZI|nr:uncharacterized protein CORC01_04851 [Colletotrichum orchidophilum]OHE99950.1 hypothetical protein CORC01_04851 [Colletotrichum orchidophilum]